MGDILASVCSALPQMRPKALITPKLTDGGLVGLAVSVRPRAIVHWPSKISFLGTYGCTGSPFMAILRSVSRRDLSLATICATNGSAWPGTPTKMRLGLFIKLKALDMT